MSESVHDHVHVGFGGAAATFIVLGTIEIVLGIIVANPAVTNLGVHDISDAIFPAIGAFVAFVTIRMRRHWPTCQAEIWAAYMIGLSNIIVIGGFTLISGFALLTAPSGINGGQLTLGLVSGVVSFAANYYWAQRLDCTDDEKRRAVSLHLRIDAYASLAVGIGSGMAYIIGSIWPALIAAVYVFYLSVRHSLPELRRLWREFHRERNHTSTDDHHH